MTNKKNILKKLREELGDDYRPKYNVHRKRIQDLRIDWKLDLKDLVDVIGYSATTISRLLSGKKEDLDAERCARLREFFEVDFFEIAVHPELVSKPAEGQHKGDSGLDESMEPLLDRIVSNVEKVHTLIKRNCEVSKIYCRTRIAEFPITDLYQQFYLDKIPPKTVETIDDLPASSVVIMGTAGQGKSIFLRHLVIEEAKRKSSIPIFIELRRLKGRNLEEVILQKLDDLELGHSKKDLNHLIKQSQISLFFDGFDELPETQRSSVVDSLKRIHDSNPSLPIVLTSRLETGVSLSEWLVPTFIAPLDIEDVEELIETYATSEQATKLLEQLEKTGLPIMEVLLAPIFVVLLIIHFEHTLELPKSSISFYKDLFDALVRRHNRADGDEKRKIKSGCSTTQIQTLLKKLSFTIHQTIGDEPVLIDDLRRMMRHIVQDDSKLQDTNSNADLIVEDIINVTNLIVEEGGYCQYIHKSVREYYSATFIEEWKADDKVSLFYEERLTHWKSWAGVLSFLQQIDRLEYLKAFAIPDLQRYAPFELNHICNSMQICDLSFGSNSVTYARLYDPDSFTLKDLGTEVLLSFGTEKISLLIENLPPSWTVLVKEQLKNNPNSISLHKTPLEYVIDGEDMRFKFDHPDIMNDPDIVDHACAAQLQYLATYFEKLKDELSLLSKS